MMGRFEECLEFVLGWEREESPGEVAKGIDRVTDDPADPGGRTNNGITQREYDVWRTRWGHVLRPVDQMTVCEMTVIYRKDYWEAMKCDHLPAPVDLVVFDTGVNMGTGTAVAMLQRCVGAADDGVMGPETLSAVDTAVMEAGMRRVCWSVLKHRRSRYRGLVGKNARLGRFLAGWLNRVAALERAVERRC